MSAIIVGPYTVDATKCNHAKGEHHCVHDWRITGRVGVPNDNTGSNDEFWGNVPKTGDIDSDAK